MYFHKHSPVIWVKKKKNTLKTAFYLFLIFGLTVEGFMWTLFVPDFAVVIFTRHSGDLFTIARIYLINLPWKIVFMLISWLIAWLVIITWAKESQ